MKILTRDQFSLMTFPLAGIFGEGIMPIPETIRLAEQSGLSYVDLFNVMDKDMPVYEQIFEKSSVGVKCYIFGTSFFEGETVIRQNLAHEMEKASRLKASLFMIVAFHPARDAAVAASLTREEMKEKMISGFRIAVEMAKPYGLKVCFETTPQDESCLSGNEDCREVLDAVPGLGLVLDSANMLPHGDTTLEAYEMLKKYIIHVHLKDVELIDPDKMPPQEIPYETAADGRVMKVVPHGQGCIPIAELCKRLKADGYRGIYAIEYAPPEDQPGDYEANLRQIERFLSYTTV